MSPGGSVKEHIDGGRYYKDKDMLTAVIPLSPLEGLGVGYFQGKALLNSLSSPSSLEGL